MGKKSRRSKATKTKKGSKPSSRADGGERQKIQPHSIATYVPDTSSFGPAPPPAAVANFWEWFQTNDRALRHLPHMEEADRIERQLKKVDPGLTYELGRLGGGRDRGVAPAPSTHHLVISADGRKNRFNSVLSLIRAAPSMDQWRFTAFRERRDMDGIVLSFEGRPCPANDIRYALSKDGRHDKIGIWLFVKGFQTFQELDERDKDYFQHICFLYLDSILGEYDVEMHIGEVVVRSQQEGRDMFGARRMYPLTELPRDFDGWLSEKIGQTRPVDGGWSSLANLGFSLDVVGNQDASKKGSPTTVACEHEDALGGFDIGDSEKNRTAPTSMPRGVTGTPPQGDPCVDLFRELFDGLVTDEGMSNMPNIVKMLYTPGIGNPSSIKEAKEHGYGWDQSVPIGGLVEIVDLKSRSDLNGKRAQVISHHYDDKRIGVRVLSSNKEITIKPVNAELVRE